MGLMTDQPRLPIPTNGIAEFCRKWRVRRFELFGSVLREDFRPDSDVDVLVTFEEGTGPTLISILAMQDELEAEFGRPVDLLTRHGVEGGRNRFRRQSILDSAKVFYAA